jgi:hypothetical protein
MYCSSVHENFGEIISFLCFNLKTGNGITKIFIIKQKSIY